VEWTEIPVKQAPTRLDKSIFKKELWTYDSNFWIIESSNKRLNPPGLSGDVRVGEDDDKLIQHPRQQIAL